MAFHFTGNRPDALDLVQDTYEASLRKLPAELPEDRVAYWLAATLRNRFIDHTRSFEWRAWASNTADDALSAIPAPEPDHQPSWAQIEPALLWQAAQRLNPVLREVFLLRGHDRLSYAEISARLDVPPSTVGTRYYRALRYLRKILVNHLLESSAGGKNRRQLRHTVDDRS
jgi:RNA polymerase sigma-70 factor (ECF subfamily)